MCINYITTLNEVVAVVNRCKTSYVLTYLHSEARRSRFLFNVERRIALDCSDLTLLKAHSSHSKKGVNIKPQLHGQATTPP